MLTKPAQVDGCASVGSPLCRSRSCADWRARAGSAPARRLRWKATKKVRLDLVVHVPQAADDVRHACGQERPAEAERALRPRDQCRPRCDRPRGRRGRREGRAKAGRAGRALRSRPRPRRGGVASGPGRRPRRWRARRSGRRRSGGARRETPLSWRLHQRAAPAPRRARRPLRLPARRPAEAQCPATEPSRREGHRRPGHGDSAGVSNRPSAGSAPCRSGTRPARSPPRDSGSSPGPKGPRMTRSGATRRERTPARAPRPGRGSAGAPGRRGGALRPTARSPAWRGARARPAARLRVGRSRPGGSAARQSECRRE